MTMSIPASHEFHSAARSVENSYMGDVNQEPHALLGVRPGGKRARAGWPVRWVVEVGGRAAWPRGGRIGTLGKEIYTALLRAVEDEPRAVSCSLRLQISN